MSIKHLEPTAIRVANVAGDKHAFHFVELDPRHTFADLFVPQFWGHFQKIIREHDLVRVVAHDASFDVMLSVIGKPQGGIVMELWPKYPGQAAPAEALLAAAMVADIKPKVVPLDRDGKPKVRVEYTKNTKWRLRGIDGLEVSRGHSTEAAANAAMEKYMGDLGLVFASKEETSEMLDEAAKGEEARKHPSRREKAA